MEEKDFIELFKKDLESKYQILDHREQKVLYLRYINNLTYKNIGKYINRSSETVRRILTTAEYKLYRVYVKNMSEYKDNKKGYTF